MYKQIYRIAVITSITFAVAMPAAQAEFTAADRLDAQEAHEENRRQRAEQRHQQMMNDFRDHMEKYPFEPGRKNIWGVVGKGIFKATDKYYKDYVKKNRARNALANDTKKRGIIRNQPVNRVN